ncbi:hypothetical protein EDC01DRAFT_729948 [Geopyxis carbonaria]|nr:hypothetical protein EDC01DRAFT_729948 [Geopyxis carbonaria]
MLSFNSSPLSVFKSKKSNGSSYLIASFNWPSERTNGHVQVRELGGSSSSSSGEDSPPRKSPMSIGIAPPKRTPVMMPPTHFPHDGSTDTKTETHVLRETTTLVTVRYKKELSSKSGDILTGTTTCHAFLDFIAAERLRSMPHQGSKWDKVLKWAEAYARKLDTYTHAVSGFTAHSWESARLVWGSCQLLLRMGSKHIALLEKVFGLLYHFGQTLDFFLKSKNLFCASAEIQNILSHAYADLVKFTVDVTIHYKKCTTIVLSDFDLHFGRTIDSFFYRKDCFTSEVWTCSLKETTRTTGSTITIRTIREWLACHDRTLEVFLSDRMGTRTTRYEYTCEWFESHLREFQRSKSDKVLWVTGKPGCGKSILTGWILEKLRRSQVKGKSYDVISFSIDGNLKSQRSSASVVKGLLLQLLERNVGDIALYKVLSALYERTEKRGVTDNLEAALWKAFESALEKSTNKLMIVVDGLDQLSGGEHAAWALGERLQQNATKWCDIKVILLSRPLSKPCGAGIKQFCIEQTHITSDIRRYVEILIKECKEFRGLKDEERTIIVEKIIKVSTCTFVYAHFAIELLKAEKTFVGIQKCLDALPPSLDGLLGKACLHLDFGNSDTKLIISCLLAAERPLTVLEIKGLLEIDVSACSHSTRLSSTEDDIFNACGSIVTIRDGLVCFSHLSIKQQIVEHCKSGKFKLTIEQAHQELVIRSMAYLKLCLKDWNPEPVMGCNFDSRQLVKEHHFLEYATRYWTAHFKRSTMYSSGGKHACTTEFKACFPDSSLLALIEGSWWETQTCATDAIEMHSLALTIRKMCLGEEHRAIIQCYINLGLTRQRTSVHTVASECYYKAWEIIRKVYGEHHSVAISCANQFITCTKDFTITKRTEIITKRTEVIYKYMWTSHKHLHGECHAETIKYAKCLAELYIQLKKTEEALCIYREVHKSCVSVYGELHEETIKITQTLVTILETSTKHHEECTTLTKTILEICEKTLECWEEKRITATIRMVEVCETRKDLKRAEELLITLRRSIIELCQHSQDEHHHHAKIEITLHYVRFLKRHGRDKEAERILIELWNDFKTPLHGDCHSDGTLIRIRIIGEELKKLKIVAVAESVFTTLYSFYKKVSKSTTTEATSIAIALSEILRIREEKHSEEIILKEIFEACITRTTVDIACIRTCLELCAFYEREEKWERSIEVCTRTLVKVWGAIITTTTTTKGGCALPLRFYEEAIQIARRLAICYTREGRIEEAERIYLFIMRSCKSTLALHDELVLTCTEYVVTFYESLKRFELAISVYEALYDEYREVLGASHTVTIRLTYQLAHFCKQHQPRRAERFYLAIVTAHGHSADECEPASIEAVLVLCRIYEADKKYRDAAKLFRSLWLAFCRHGGECGMATDTVVEVYHKYVFMLEKEQQFKHMYEVTVQFRDACVRHYGKFASITITATIQLARILERDEARHEEAMKIYEEVITIITKSHELSISMATVVVEVKTRLALLYSAHASSTAKAEAIYFECWEEHRRTHGCAHKASLSRLVELILFFKKQGTKECTHTATVTLQTTILEILTKETDTQRLFDAACTLARLYLDLGLSSLAFELVKELRLQISSTDVRTCSKFHFSLRAANASVDRRAFVFVVAFEETLTGHTHDGLYARIMADLMAETTLYERWMRALQYGGGFAASLAVGARLRLFLLSKSRDEECAAITDELWTLFLAEVGEDAEKAEKAGIVWTLFLSCISDEASATTGILAAAASAVTACYDSGDFDGALQLAGWTHRYIAAHGGFCDAAAISAGFTLALTLAGRSTAAWKRCHTAPHSSQLLALSRTILTEVLAASSTASFTAMPLAQLNAIITLLGEHRSFPDLERILRTLWTSRNTQPWGPDLIVALGLRLVEVLFAHAHREEALELCTDICYNLRRVWGALDAATVRAFNLLSALHTAAGQVGRSVELHTEVLEEVLAGDEGDVEADEAGEVVVGQLKLLKRAAQRLAVGGSGGSGGSGGGSGGSGGAGNGGGRLVVQERWVELWDEFVELFGPEHPMWSKIDNVRTWARPTSSAGVGVRGNEEVGCWTAPKVWGFLEDEGVGRRGREGG